LQTPVWSEPVAKRKPRAQLESERFHAIVVELLRVRYADWNEWELDWLLDQAQRPTDYEYTDKQEAVLKRLVARTRTFTQYAGYTVSELMAIAYPGRFDVDEGNKDFVETVYRWNAKDLKVRQIRILAGICRSFEDIPQDAEVDAAAEQTFTQDEAA
jgi:hypothetical protein